MNYRKTFALIGLAAVLSFGVRTLSADPIRIKKHKTNAQADAVIVANALLSWQIADQIKEFGGLGVKYVSVKVEQMEDLDVITLEGTIIRGFDIACGTAKMTINKTSEPAEMGMGGRVTRYRATIDKPISNSNPSCK